MKTATLTIAFIFVSPFQLKNYLALNNVLSGFQSIDTQISSDFKGNNQLNVSSSGYSDNARVSYSVNTGYTMNKASKD